MPSAADVRREGGGGGRRSLLPLLDLEVRLGRLWLLREVVVVVPVVAVVTGVLDRLGSLVEPAR